MASGRNRHDICQGRLAASACTSRPRGRRADGARRAGSRFQPRIACVSRSYPSVEIVPGASTNRAPAATGISSHRAASTRRMCPCANATASPSAAPHPGDHPVRPRADLARASRRPGSRRATGPSRGAARGSAAWSGPRTRRSPTRAGPRRSRPGRRARRARRSRAPAAAGCTAPARTSPPGQPWRNGPARLRPSSVSGRSVRLVCCPDMLHSVSPWRTSRISLIVLRSLRCVPGRPSARPRGARAARRRARPRGRRAARRGSGLSPRPGTTWARATRSAGSSSSSPAWPHRRRSPPRRGRTC